MKSIATSLRGVVLGCAGLGLAACGSSVAELKIMDAPPDGVTAVSLFVKSMDVHVVDKDKAKDADPNDSSIDKDDKWQTLEVNKAIDLVQHQGEGAAESLGELELPDGKVTQIRLVLDAAQPNTATVDGVPCDLDLSQVPALGVKINHPFKAFETDGDKHEIIVDFDLAASMKAQGGCYRLEPVIKLQKVRTDGKDVST